MQSKGESACAHAYAICLDDTVHVSGGRRKE